MPSAALPFPIGSRNPRTLAVLAATWSDCGDPELAELTASIDALRARYDALPNGEDRNALHAKCSALVAQRRARFERLVARGVVVGA